MQNVEDEAKVVKMERIEERECHPSVTSIIAYQPFSRQK